jgi:hypothetical protein
MEISFLEDYVLQWKFGKLVLLRSVPIKRSVQWKVPTTPEHNEVKRLQKRTSDTKSKHHPMSSHYHYVLLCVPMSVFVPIIYA